MTSRYGLALVVLLVCALCPSRLYATDLLVTKEASPTQVAVGDTVYFSISIFNNKDGNIPTDVILRDRFSLGLELIDITGDLSLAFCVFVDEGVDCTFAMNAPEEKHADFVFVAKEPGELINTVSVTPSVGELKPDDNVAQDTVTVVALQLTKVGSRCPSTECVGIKASSKYYYRLTVSNTEQRDEWRGLQLRDRLPVELNATEFRVIEISGKGECIVQNSDIPISLFCEFELIGEEEFTILFRLDVSPDQLHENICNTAILSREVDITSATACDSVKERYVSYEEAEEKAKALSACPSGKEETCPLAYQTFDGPFPEGTDICTAGTDDEGCTTLDDEYYITYWDRAANALFYHNISLAPIPAYTDQSVTPEPEFLKVTDFPPEVVVPDSSTGEYTTFSLDQMHALADPLPASEYELYVPPETTTITTPDNPRICALIVTGYPITDTYNHDDRLSFQATALVMQNYLTRMALGPRLPASSLGEPLHNPTVAELKARMATLKDKCDVFYFYYVGHGKETGIALIKSNPSSGESKHELFAYEDLAREIYMVGAGENTVVLDNCNSGAAQPAFKADIGYKKQDLTLLTGASASNRAYLAYRTSVPRVNLSIYTVLLANSTTDIRSDTNDDGVVSLRESHVWLRRENRRILKFSNSEGGVDRFGIIEKQDPTILENRLKKNDGGEPIYIFVDAGVVVYVSADKNGSSDHIEAVRVEEVQPREGALPQDADLLELAAGRQRTVEVIEAEGSQGYSVDIAFRMDAVFDSLTMTGLPGLAYRSTDSTAWEPLTRTAWNPEDSTVTVFGVTSPGTWAYARTTGASAVAIEAVAEGVPRAFALHGNYPNPFNPSTTIRFDLPETARVEVRLFDLLGRTALVQSAEHVSGGFGRTLAVDASSLASGVYLYRLTARGTSHTYRSTGRMVLVR